MTDSNKHATQKALDDYQLINQPPTYFSGRKGGDAAAAVRSKVAFVVFVFLLQPQISGGLGGNGRGVIASRSRLQDAPAHDDESIRNNSFESPNDMRKQCSLSITHQL